MPCLRNQIWIIFQEERISETGDGADARDSTLSVHASFLIKAMSQREEHVRDISVNLLVQLRDKFPQVILFVILKNTGGLFDFLVSFAYF